MSLPEGPLVAWYGDDFTGAAAVMEVLTFAGFPSVLFFDVPDAAQLVRFGALRGIGIAGEARSKSPAWMAEHLPPIYRALRETGAPIV
ncbi:MAG: four-carbon acid sugar kinase family protein, partial [Pseudomonadota bacterium]